VAKKVKKQKMGEKALKELQDFHDKKKLKEKENFESVRGRWREQSHSIHYNAVQQYKQDCKEIEKRECSKKEKEKDRANHNYHMWQQKNFFATNASGFSAARSILKSGGGGGLNPAA